MNYQRSKTKILVYNTEMLRLVFIPLDHQAHFIWTRNRSLTTLHCFRVPHSLTKAAVFRLYSQLTGADPGSLKGVLQRSRNGSLSVRSRGKSMVVNLG